MSKRTKEELGKNIKSTKHLENVIKQVFIGVVVAIITTKITAVVTNLALLQKLALAFQFTFLALIPFLLPKIFPKINISANRLKLVIFSTVLILGFSALFSMLPGGSIPNPPKSATRIHKVFVDDYVDLRSSDFNELRVTKDIVLTVRETHVLLDVEWDKQERVPFLQRNYKGQLYYKVRYRCGDSKKPQLKGHPELLGYQLKPGRIVLSWLIGFIEIPFVLDTDKTVPETIQEALQGNSELCD